eukprot:1180696-Prorocentrum_minimum.AAC.4
MARTAGMFLSLDYDWRTFRRKRRDEHDSDSEEDVPVDMFARIKDPEDLQSLSIFKSWNSKEKNSRSFRRALAKGKPVFAQNSHKSMHRKTHINHYQTVKLQRGDSAKSNRSRSSVSLFGDRSDAVSVTVINRPSAVT